MNEKTVKETLQEMYQNFFSAEKKVADFILANPEATVNANVSELAELSDVSDATVTRLCKHMGYQGYHQLRINLSRDLGRKQGMVSAGKDGTAASLMQEAGNTIADLGKHIGEEKVQECVKLLLECNYAHLVAVGNTAPLAQYMGFRLGRLGIRCTYNMLPEYFLNCINVAQRNDIVFAISQSGTSKNVVKAMELAKEKNLKTIAVTGSEYSPMSRMADCLLLSSVDKQVFDYMKNFSHLNEMAVIDVVLECLTKKANMTESNTDELEIMLSEFKY